MSFLEVIAALATIALALLVGALVLATAFAGGSALLHLPTIVLAALALAGIGVVTLTLRLAARRRTRKTDPERAGPI